MTALATCTACAETIADLRDRVAHLERDLGESVAATDLTTIRRAYGLTNNEAWLLLALYQASPRVMTFEALLARMPCPTGDPLDRNLNQTCVVAHRVRAKAGADTLETVFGVGYRITAAGRCQVERARQ